MIPVYFKIENDIKEKILSGKYKSGDKIPSENELTEIYDVSRMTVRQAMNNLVNDGYLLKYKGKGTFVSNNKIEKNIQGVRSFTEEMEASGKKVSSKIISMKEMTPDKSVSEKLFLEKGDKVYKIERIRYADQLPILFENLYIPQNIFKNIPKKVFEGSFYNYIENELRLKIAYCHQTIEAKMPPQNISESLKITKQLPILFIIRHSFLSNGRPFEYVESSYRSDQYKFVQSAYKG